MQAEVACHKRIDVRVAVEVEGGHGFEQELALIFGAQLDWFAKLKVAQGLQAELATVLLCVVGVFHLWVLPEGWMHGGSNWWAGDSRRAKGKGKSNCKGLNAEDAEESAKGAEEGGGR